MREKVLYLIFGGLTTLINYVVLYAFFWGFGFAAWLSNVIAWVAAVTFAFITNKLLVFKSERKDIGTVMRELIPFVSARLITLGVSSGIIYIFIDRLGFDTVTQSFAVITVTQIITIVANYFASKYLIFTQKQARATRPK
jgi:putative flippase GtrA